MNIPKVHSNGLISTNISNSIDRRTALLHLRNDARSTPGGSHQESETKERTVSLRIRRWRFSSILLVLPVGFTIPRECALGFSDGIVERSLGCLIGFVRWRGGGSCGR